MWQWGFPRPLYPGNCSQTSSASQWPSLALWDCCSWDLWALCEWLLVAAVLIKGALKCVFWLLISWGVWLFEKALFVTSSLRPGPISVLAVALYLGFYSSGFWPLGFSLMASGFGCQKVSCSSLVFWFQILSLAVSCSLALKSFVLLKFFPKVTNYTCISFSAFV